MGRNSRYYYRFYNTSYLYNPDVKWETTITRNLGVDFGFFKERLSGSLDIYWNTVKICSFLRIFPAILVIRVS